MGYIGNSYEIQRSSSAIDYFNGNGVTTTFTLSRPVISNTGMIVVVNNVPQNPASSYALNASNQIVFTEAPSVGTNNIYVQYNSVYGQVGAIGQGTVGTSALGSISNINSIGNNLTLQTNGTTALNVDQNQNIAVSKNVTAEGSIGQLGNAYAEKTVNLGYFPNGVINQVVYLNFGNNAINGYMEVEVNSTFSNQNSVGILRKVFSFGYNPNNSQWYPATSRVSEADGTIVNNIVIGELEWDASSSQYRLPIYHIVSTGNQYYARVKSFAGNPSGQALQYMTVSGFSTRAAPTTSNNVSFRGAVTAPNQPYVILGPQLTSASVVGSTDGSTFANIGSANGYLAVIDNSQRYWDGYKFNCPVTGMYQISISGIKYPQGGVLHIDLRQNGGGVSYGRCRAEETATYCQFGSTYIVKCNAGDTLAWWAFGGAGFHGGHGIWSIRLAN